MIIMMSVKMTDCTGFSTNGTNYSRITAVTPEKTVIGWCFPYAKGPPRFRGAAFLSAVTG